MNIIEKTFYEKAKSKGIRLLEINKNNIMFALNGEYAKIKYDNPSDEFITLMKEIFEK